MSDDSSVYVLGSGAMFCAGCGLYLMMRRPAARLVGQHPTLPSCPNSDKWFQSPPLPVATAIEAPLDV